jgi:hypothetical protein
MCCIWISAGNLRDRQLGLPAFSPWMAEQADVWAAEGFVQLRCAGRTLGCSWVARRFNMVIAEKATSVATRIGSDAKAFLELPNVF